MLYSLIIKHVLEDKNSRLVMQNDTFNPWWNAQSGVQRKRNMSFNAHGTDDEPLNAKTHKK